MFCEWNWHTTDGNCIVIWVYLYIDSRLISYSNTNYLLGIKIKNILVWFFLRESADTKRHDRPQYCATSIQANLCSLIKARISVQFLQLDDLRHLSIVLTPCLRDDSPLHSYSSPAEGFLCHSVFPHLLLLNLLIWMLEKGTDQEPDRSVHLKNTVYLMRQFIPCMFTNCENRVQAMSGVRKDIYFFNSFFFSSLKIWFSKGNMQSRTHVDVRYSNHPKCYDNHLRPCNHCDSFLC